MNNPRTGLAVALVGAVALLAYGNNLSNGFAMDDGYNVVQNESIRSLADVPSYFTSAWGATASEEYDQALNRSYWRPMSTVSFAVDYAVYGLRPWGWHLTNNLLHGAVSMLVLLLMLRLGTSLPAALAGGLLFALHPLHTEAVDLVTYRTELLATLFSLLAIIVHLAPERRRWTGVLVALLYAAGLASKETAVTLPGWILLLDLARGERRLASLALPQAGLAAVLVAYLALRNALLPGTSIHFFAGLDGGLVFMSVMKIYLLYVRLLILPWPLTPFYDWTILPPASSMWDVDAIAGCIALLLTVAIAGLLWRLGRRLAAAGILCWLIGLIPVMHLAPIPVGAAERFLYFPSVGVMIAAGIGAIGLASRLGRPRWLAQALAVAVCGLLAAGTLSRNQAWESDRTLLEQTAHDYPGSFNAHHALGQLHHADGRLESAVRSFYTADEILPDFAPNVGWLVRALLDAGRAREALSSLDQALRARGPDRTLLLLRVEAVRMLEPTSSRR